MALGPRLDLRQSQSLVMTPQLQQAIKLLQFSNLQVAAFVEEELERNPLLERDERATEDFGGLELPALDQITPVRAEPAGAADGFAEPPDPPDAADAAGSDMLPVGASEPTDTTYVEAYDPGGPSDGVPSAGRNGGGNGSDNGEWRGVDEYVPDAPTLREHLDLQIRLAFGDPADRIIAAQLVAHQDSSGRLAIAPEQLAATLGTEFERLERVRARMLQFEPTGMFARDLRECLAAQLAERNRLDPAMAALLDNLDLLAARDMRGLMAVCGVDAADLTDMAAELRRLDPKPGSAFDAAPPLPVIPDILMRRLGEADWLLELNSESLPRVLVNHSFSARVIARGSREDRIFVADKLQTANWLVKSLQQRAQTILKVASDIVRQQDGFFRHGIGHLRPLILRDVAASVEMHESTVSRVTSGKYIATPRGTFELKYFFTTAIAGTDGETHSAEVVRWRIRSMIAAETADAVLSDDAIVATLRSEGVDIARRTVAKYREALRIPSSVQRKREKAEAI
jgi:RNA polymerase sigma-54 factor